MLDQNDIKALESFTTKTDKFTLNGHETYAKVVYVYDGDTIHIVFKMPGQPDKCYKWVVRMMGIDTPEMKSKNAGEKAAAVAARDYLKSLIQDKVVVVKCLEFDKYGRLLANIYQVGDMNKSLSQLMIEKGHAKAYDGGTKEGWAELEVAE